MPRILLAEDNDHVRLLVARSLKARHEVFEARDGREALDLAGSLGLDLAVADMVMPGMDGLALLGELRKGRRPLPLIMITANDSFDLMKRCFAAGADDFMTKPINCEELLMRIDAVLRRAGIERANRIEIGEAVLDRESFSLSRSGVTYDLTRKEFELLFKLLSEPGRIYTRNQLMDSVWGRDSESGEDTIKTHLSRLRQKLRDFPEFDLVAVKGIGYKAEVAKEGSHGE